MTSDECAHTDLAAAWVLGMLTPVEAERFAEHLAACATCHAEVANLQEAVDAMADAVPPASPPVDLRARLMAAVEQEVDLFRAAGAYEAAPAKSRAHRSRVRRALTVLAGVALVGGGAVLGGLLASGEDRGPEPRTIPGVVTRGGGGPGARAAVLVRNDRARLVLSDLARPPDGRIYQAWLVRPPFVPVPTGALFSVAKTGDTTIILPALGDAVRVIVTSEPQRGSTAPTLPPVVAVRLPVNR